MHLIFRISQYTRRLQKGIMTIENQHYDQEFEEFLNRNAESRKEYQKEYRQRPENKQKKKHQQSTIEGKQKARAYQKTYDSKPSNKERKKEYNRLYKIRTRNKNIK